MSEESQVETTEQVDTSGVEKEARLQGWVPKEEFRGDEADWIDANTFVQRGKEINPILRKNNERIQRELEITKRQMEELRATTEEFKKFQKEAYDRKLQEYEEQIQDLKELKKKAVSESDGELVVQIDDKIDALKDQQKKTEQQQKTQPEKQVAPEIDPQVVKDVETWIGTNKWYTSDPKMKAAADVVANQVRKDNPYLVGKEFFDALDKELESIFSAEKLGKKSRARSLVDGGDHSNTSKGGKKSYENLPPEAKQACDKYVKQKLMTREEYINTYDWS